ncbi:MAG TPA: hypothetical protein P5242_19845, partial [Sedimentisphaerales bacterium]|nr:hypothetical protein [Sedimentisphaerales bacterium]
MSFFKSWLIGRLLCRFYLFGGLGCKGFLVSQKVLDANRATVVVTIELPVGWLIGNLDAGLLRGSPCKVFAFLDCVLGLGRFGLLWLGGRGCRYPLRAPGSRLGDDDVLFGGLGCKGFLVSQKVLD